MSILKPAFNILIICGCWMPTSWGSIRARTLYIVYRILVLVLLHSFCISQLLNVILSVRTADELSESLYMCIASILACCKIVTLLANHENIKILVEKLRRKPCKPSNKEELDIRNKFDNSIGLITIYYTVLVELTVLCMILSSLFTDLPVRKLAYRAWLPFNYTKNYYCAAYVHQIVGLIGTSLLNVACDTILCGLFVHACAQQEILIHRMNRMTEKREPNMGRIVDFHDYLYGYASVIQEKFKAIIGVQILSSTMVVCFILYQLTNTSPMSSKYLQFVLYLACMMTQIFFYCWFGNELKLKSLEIMDAIFQTSWVPLDNKAKKSLIIMMRRALNPIEIVCGYMFTMDLDTFVAILKMSYSIYNLLQRRKT